jgi:hypothetical protein
MESYKMKFVICFLALFAVAMAGTSVSLPINRPMNPFVDFFVGFYDGLKDSFNQDVINVQQCIAAPVNVWNDILDFVNYIKNIEWKNFDFNEFINQLMGFAQNVLTDVMPCIIIGMAIDKFVELIMNPTMDTLQKVMMQTLMANIMTLINIVQNLVEDIMNFDMHDVGSDLSSILYIIVIH